MSRDRQESPEQRNAMTWLTERFERLIVAVLLVVMMLAILVSTADLAWTFIKELIRPPMFLINVEEVMKIFGLVFTVLIGLELLETIRTVLSKDELHVEVVFLVAMIAVARKVILLKIEKPEDFVLPLGIGAVILALALGFYLVKLAYRTSARGASHSDDEH